MAKNVLLFLMIVKCANFVWTNVFNIRFFEVIKQMIYDLQKPTLWKRVSAYLLDIVLIITLAVGFATVISAITGYDAKYDQLIEYRNEFGEKHGIDFNISQEDFNKLSTDEQKLFNDKYEEVTKLLIKSEKYMKLNSLVINLTLITTSLGILLAVLCWEFIIPLFLKNGQTVGKKVFGIAVMRTNGVKISTLQLFVRAILGKYTFEIMLPVFAVLMVVFANMLLFGVVVIAAISIAQVVALIVTRNTRQALHDLLSDTVTVDLASQLIFDTEEELIKYKEEQHAKMVERSPY